MTMWIYSSDTKEIEWMQINVIQRNNKMNKKSDLLIDEDKVGQNI